MKKYTLELDGQRDFYQTYLPRVDKTLSLEQIITDNTDGVLNGNLLEFKLNINDLNSVLFQSIKYLSSMRIKGKSIPANILLISLNTNKAYQFYSQDYLPFIEKVYTLGASKENNGFQGSAPITTFDLNEEVERENFIKILKSNNYTKINLDENCIVGWGERFYRENPMAKKSDFIGEEGGKVNIIGEIRKPNKLKKFIEPYEGEDNIKFRYLMDKLNDNLTQKNLGAFYTHKLYAQKSLELVREAIKRVPEGNDYVIIDRCAGTGNLEQFMTDDELSHTIVSTVEYYEYKVLFELLGDKVRHIIPPTEESDTFNAGLVRGADALSEEYINSKLIKQYINNPKCTIILFENPPYAETTSIEHQKQKAGKKSSIWKNSFVVQEMKKEVKGTASNDLGNAFIWSAFKYYLRQPTDSYIVYSPVKYWKAQHLISKKFLNGFAFNRRHFHTNIDACIMVALWSNEDDLKTTSFDLQAFNIDKEQIKNEGNIKIERIFNSYSEKYFDTRKFIDDENSVLCELNGKEISSGKKIRIKPLFNENILGYMAVYSSGFDNPDLHSSLLIAGRYDGNGFFLRNDNFMEKLPMFAASRYITYNRFWTERARIMKSADGADSYLQAVKNGKIFTMLQKILLFTCLETQNHMRTFTGSDGRFYRNQLCLDCSNGNTLAKEKLANFIPNEQEQQLLKQWDLVLENAKKTANYDRTLTYGVYQIIDELNTSHKDEKNKTVYDYPELNGHLNTLKQLVKKYYLDEIVPFLFEYEFLK
ncbi:MAG: hypothetical protein KH094_09465 [Haemophilus parainfluenzae]|nr:hypothetical protein [Haemophilus parainfluenzae]